MEQEGQWFSLGYFTVVIDTHTQYPILMTWYKATRNKKKGYWQWERHKNKLNRIESPEIDPHIYSQLIFKKNARAIQSGKDKSLHQIVLDNLLQKIKLDLYLTQYIKSNSKWIKDLNVIP